MGQARFQEITPARDTNSYPRRTNSLFLGCGADMDSSAILESEEEAASEPCFLQIGAAKDDRGPFLVSNTAAEQTCLRRECD